ncbi:thioesterase II family protein [Streptomyces mangrovisoli]|uniref:Thioesterase n=1 Tax=Streptomyces mangrovisoli TaxID=1428628 RepID=A0A1J4NMW5_9ACTN|nr:alpha/beta fold hydrolase [Streptomyces mangrovisoli]OIJ63643.1 thioesterase [Streptomyces mangrovisoli]
MSAVLSPRWLVSGPPGTARLQLYCFAHGGGSAAEYLRWTRGLGQVRTHAVQLPGRGPRLAEPPLTSMRRLVEAFLAEVPPAEGPFAFFGHSLGALVSYEITRALVAEGRPLPAHLVVSAHPAPHLPRRAGQVHRLPDDRLLDTVAGAHGGIPDEVLASPELRGMAAAALRADYQVLETYTWRPAAPLPVPVTVFGGEEDAVTSGELEAWREHTTERATVRRFPGGHFYLRERPAHVLRALAAALGSTSASGTSGVSGGAGASGGADRSGPC